MQFSKIWQVCALLSSVAYAVVLEKAFTQEHLTHLIRDVEQIDSINSNRIVGLGHEQFLSIDTTHNVPRVEWSIDLRDLKDFNTYHLSNKKSLVFLYSSSSPVVNLYETRFGIFQKSSTLDSSPVSFYDFFNRGVLVSTRGGKLYFIDSAGDVTFIEGVNSIVLGYQQINGFAYLLNSKSLVKINPATLEVVSDVSVPFTALKFKDEIVVASNGDLYKFNDSTELFVKVTIDKSVKSIGDFKSAHILNSAFVLLPLKSSLEILKIDGNDVEHSYSLDAPDSTGFEFKNHGLSEFIIVSRETSKDVYDLTDFLELGDSSSIKHVKVTQSLKSTFIEPQGNELLLITLTNPNEGFKFNLLDGTTKQHFKQEQFINTDNDKYLLIDKVHSHELEINSLEEKDLFVLISIIKRLVRHLSELGRYIVSFIKSASNAANLEDFGFGKLIVFFDSEKNVFVALDSELGIPVWKSITLNTNAKLVNLVELSDKVVALFSDNAIYAISAATGEVISKKELPAKYIDIFTVDHNGEKQLLFKTQDSFKAQEEIKGEIYLYNVEDNVVNGFKLSSAGSLKTWRFKKTGEKVIKVISKPKDSKTNSLAIPLAEKDILFKYLYPNTITILTLESSTLRLYLVDAITGNVLYEQENTNAEEVNLDSINLIMDDNWIVYSFYVKSFEQRINVIDLFDSSKAVSDGTTVTSVFNYNNTIDSISEKSYIFPEKIVSLSSTQSRFGVTIKSILLVTETGKLFELPKYVLNSRRIDNRALTPEDFQSDFKMMPYHPLILADSKQIVNHKHKLFVDKVGLNNKVLIKATHFESTAVLCMLNKYNHFCGVVQPSLSFDLLDKNFSKYKLIATIVFLFGGYSVSNFFVQKKRLREQWIDRQ